MLTKLPLISSSLSPSFLASPLGDISLLNGGAWSTSDPLSGGGAPPLSARGLP